MKPLQNGPFAKPGSLAHGSSAHEMQAEVKAGFYLSDDGEWIPDGWKPRPFSELST